MNVRSEAEGAPKGPVRKRLARLIEPAVPRQARRAGRPEELGTSSGYGLPSGAPLADALGGPSAYTSVPVPRQAADARPAPGTAVPPPGREVAAPPQAHPEPAAAGQPGVAADPLEHPQVPVAADAAGVESLLRCWVRETGAGLAPDGTLRLPLDAIGATLVVPVRYWSPVDYHRFGRPRLEGESDSAPPMNAVALAALLGREAAHAAADAPEAESAALVGRVADSVQRTAQFLADRRTCPRVPDGTGPFLAGEQALLFGHPLHPTPKSREGLSEAESRAFSPETRGRFPLHWMAADRSVLAGESAWTERGRPVAADDLATRVAGPWPARRLPAGTVPVPLHPWQARELRHLPEVTQLLESGLLHDLGQGGELWYPTSSVRTVTQPGGTAMLKLSLGLRITNSRRENLRKELLRGVEVHRVLRSGLGQEWRAAHPGFDIVRDPAWLGIDVPGAGRLPGFDTVIRHNPFGPEDDAVCVAGLTAPVPAADGPPETLRSRLQDVVETLAQRTGRPRTAVAAEWFLRYLDVVVRPVLWLDGHAGIALEAHQQNTLVLLDADGWPTGGRYRDNQGYYFRTSRRAELEQRLPGARVGEASDTFVADDVIDERFAYYLGINNVLGLIGAFGSQRLADEQLLLAAFRRFLERAAAGTDGEPVSPLPRLLLEAGSLRCKANLLTRLHGMDELVGPVDTQSVYVTLSNPLAH
ncbi:IucA/IucC family protein [Streptomyces sp. NHF165]|uniref:IucA/IucC family protein n=1 Tax=Streptomyces sp. NHF165 TaxID=2175864 RepID=UPI001F3B4129|nr:IucA/IucC family protein [Streptomyces sp. NHF165]